MPNTISSRTPEGSANHCPICDNLICIEPSQPPGDAPCPTSGTLLWFFNTSEGMRFHDSTAVAPLRERILQIIFANLGLNEKHVDFATSFHDDGGADSLDIVELVMELEEVFGITITDVEAEKIKTVGDAIDYLAKRKL